MIKKIILLLLFIPSISFGTILFEDNFDDHTDWEPTQDTGSGYTYHPSDGNATTACTGCPDGTAKYMGYYLQKSAWPTLKGHNTMKISTDNARSGKALTHWTEPIEADCDGNGWCSDGQLSIDLGGNYNEVYIRFYIKFQSGYNFDENNDPAYEKIFRISHYWDTVYHPYQYGSTYDQHPIVVMDTGQSTTYQDNGLFIWGPRYQSTYTPTEATPPHAYTSTTRLPDGTGYQGYKTHPEVLSDNTYHQIIVYVKGNSAAGVADGIYRVYLDGVQIINDTAMAWADSGGVNWEVSDFAGWNWVSIGGNSRNYIYPVDGEGSATSEEDALDQEQWYAIDDVVIATTYEEALNGNGVVAPTPSGAYNIR